MQLSVVLKSYCPNSAGSAGDSCLLSSKNSEADVVGKGELDYQRKEERRKKRGGGKDYFWRTRATIKWSGRRKNDKNDLALPLFLDNL